VAEWFEPQIILGSSYAFVRDPNARIPVRLDGDTAGGFRAPSTISNSRRRELSATVTPARLFSGLIGDSSVVTRLMRRIQPLSVTVGRDRRSTFDRPPFDAPFGYQLGLGSLDDFRFRNGLAATAAGETKSLVAGGALSLPLGLVFRANYNDQRSQTFSRRLGTNEQAQVNQRNREWPSLGASWSINMRGVLGGVVTLINANGRLARTLAESRHTGLTEGEESVSETRGHSIQPSMTVTWIGGLVTTFTINRNTSEQLTSGNLTQRVQQDVGGVASFDFRPPSSIVRLPNDIRTTLSYNRSSTDICLVRAGSGECTPVANSRRTALDIRMDTGFSSQLRGGLSFSYVVTEQRHTSQELAQVIFTFFAEIFFVTGQLR
jgi:hypothetical protein